MSGGAGWGGYMAGKYKGSFGWRAVIRTMVAKDWLRDPKLLFVVRHMCSL